MQAYTTISERTEQPLVGLLAGTALVQQAARYSRMDGIYSKVVRAVVVDYEAEASAACSRLFSGE